MKYKFEYTSQDERLKYLFSNICISSRFNIVCFGYFVIGFCLSFVIRNIKLIKLFCVCIGIIALYFLGFVFLYNIIRQRKCNMYFVQMDDDEVCVRKNSKLYSSKLKNITKCFEVDKYYFMYVNKIIPIIVFKDVIDDEQSFREFILSSTKTKSIININQRIKKFMKFIFIIFVISLIIFIWFDIVLFR